MAFTDPARNDPQKEGAGECKPGAVILTWPTFENGLKVGRFCKLAAGQIDNIDGSAYPTVAGVVLRDAVGPIDSGSTLSTGIHSRVQVVRSGMATVRIKTGETPAQLGRVYVSNAGDANDGLATATVTDLAISAEFIQDLGGDVWLINLLPNYDLWTVGLIPALWSALTVADWATAADVSPGVKSISLQLRDLNGVAVSEVAVLRLTCDGGATLAVSAGTALAGDGTRDVIAQTTAAGLLTLLVSCAGTGTINIVAGPTQASAAIDCRDVGAAVFA